jgi:hypothetical protein
MTDDAFAAALRRFAPLPHAARFRCGWIIGPPASGKTQLARRVAQHQGWAYCNYTRDPGYFDSLGGRIIGYRVEHFLRDLAQWRAGCPEQLLIVDELDALAAFWATGERRSWMHAMMRLGPPGCAVIGVTHLFGAAELRQLAPPDWHWAVIETGGA